MVPCVLAAAGLRNFWPRLLLSETASAWIRHCKTEPAINHSIICCVATKRWKFSHFWMFLLLWETNCFAVLASLNNVSVIKTNKRGSDAFFDSGNGPVSICFVWNQFLLAASCCCWHFSFGSVFERPFEIFSFSTTLLILELGPHDDLPKQYLLGI